MGMALVTWWCTTIGITNLGAIQLAAGIFAGGTLILFGLMILIVVIAVDDKTARGCRERWSLRPACSASPVR